jgi:hypothetical protein
LIRFIHALVEHALINEAFYRVLRILNAHQWVSSFLPWQDRIVIWKLTLLLNQRLIFDDIRAGPPWWKIQLIGLLLQHFIDESFFSVFCNVHCFKWVNFESICQNRSVILWWWAILRQVSIDGIMLSSTFRTFFWTPITLTISTIGILYMSMLNDISKILMKTQSCWLIVIHFLDWIRNLHEVCVLSILEISSWLILLWLDNWWFLLLQYTIRFGRRCLSVSQLWVICSPGELPSRFSLVSLVLLLRFNLFPFLC